MRTKTAFAIFAGFIGVIAAQPAAAQKTTANYPPVFVLGEEDDDGLISCGLTYAAAIDRIRSRLNAAGVPVGTEEQAVTQQALTFYVNLNVAPIIMDGEDAGSCYGGVNVHLASYAVLDEPVSGDSRFAMLAFCIDGFTFTLSRNSLRRSILNELDTKVTYCLNEWNSSREA